MVKNKRDFKIVINFKDLIMPLVPILESKSQNGTQIFKSLKMVPFLLKRLTFALVVKSTLTPLEGVPRVSSSIF